MQQGAPELVYGGLAPCRRGLPRAVRGKGGGVRRYSRLHFYSRPVLCGEPSPTERTLMATPTHETRLRGTLRAMLADGKPADALRTVLDVLAEETSEEFAAKAAYGA